MSDEEIIDHEVFDISDVKITYHRSRDGKRVTMELKDSRAISEMKLYLIMGLEVEKLERRLGISEPHEGCQ